MAKTLPRTILLKGRGYRMEKVAAGTITPGHLVKLDSNGELVVQNAAGVKCLPVYAVEDDHNGKDIDDNYVDNDYVQAEILGPGCEVNGLVAASAAALVIGDAVESAGDGTVRKVVLLTGTLTGTPDGALTDITFNATWSAGQANEIDVNFEEIQLILNTLKASTIGICIKAVDNSAGVTPARCQFVTV
jgi:hypothetical protein